MATTLLDLTKLIDGILKGSAQGVPAHAVGEQAIAAIGLDSSSLPTSDAIFAAVPGTRTHGAQFAGTDNAAKAVAILTDAAGLEVLNEAGETRPIIVVDDVRAVLGAASSSIYGDPSKDFTLIGVTGTSGKTTTSYLLEKGLMEAGHKVGLIGTTGTRIDGEEVPTKLTLLKTRTDPF